VLIILADFMEERFFFKMHCIYCGEKVSEKPKMAVKVVLN
jgi:hypothetical protein